MDDAHVKLIDFFLSTHAAAFTAAVATFASYSDRTDGFGRSLAGTTRTLTEIRRRLASQLSEKLTPVFECPGAVPSPILVPDGGTYVEYPVNPVGSESFREAVREFLDSSTAAIADYRTLALARDKWCGWSRLLCTLLLYLIVWELLVVAGLFLGKYEYVEIHRWIVFGSAGPTALLILGSAVAVFFRLSNYWTITGLRLKHGEL
jgi:hypothetical protein